MKIIKICSILLAFTCLYNAAIGQKKALNKKITRKLPIVTKSTATTDSPFMLKGFTPNFNDGTKIKVLLPNNNKYNGPEAIVQNKQFLLTGNLPSPGIYNLMISTTTQGQNANYISIFLANEPSAIKFTGEAGNFEVIEGESLKAYSSLLETFSDKFDSLSRIQQQQQKPGAKQESLKNEWDNLIAKTVNQVPDYLKENKKTPVSAFLLFILRGIMSNDIAKLENWMSSIDSSAMNNSYGKTLKDFVANEKFLAYGQEAPDFIQNDTEGNPVSLKRFRGKYVLIDFWASWCGPCRRENPNVVNAYNKFKNKSFTILGVSLDKDKTSWVKAITNDGLAWSQVSDLGSWNNAAARLYKVESIPQNFLLDPAGKIIGKNLRGEELHSFLAKVLN